MELEEAIVHARQVADGCSAENRDCAYQHDKLADWLEELKRYRATDVADKGEISDGYHTFNELYHHRAVLFSVVCHCHKFFAWKSKKHADGSMYDGMFIVGINTPNGPATYHYDIDPYWGMFDVKELENAPEWDGHTPTDAIERIASLVHRPPMWAV